MAISHALPMTEHDNDDFLLLPVTFSVIIKSTISAYWQTVMSHLVETLEDEKQDVYSSSFCTSCYCEKKKKRILGFLSDIDVDFAIFLYFVVFIQLITGGTV
jgi:hypothetical protein